MHQSTYQRIVEYPAKWKDCLPYPNNPVPGLQMDRSWPFNIQGHGIERLKEWNMAGEWQYWTKNRPIPSGDGFLNSDRIQFPYAGNRAPYWVQFYDLESGNTHPRILNLFTVHTSPKTAVQMMRNMAGVPEIAAVQPNNAVNIVLGDFNVDSFGKKAGAYNWMINGIYTMHWDPRVAHAGLVRPNRRPYCVTHFLPLIQATPFRKGKGQPSAQNNVYPRYGYMGTSWPKLSESGAIDNVFTAYGNNAGGPPHRHNMTIANTVVGTPYNRLAAPTYVTAELRGGLQISSSLNNKIPLNPAPGGIVPWTDTIAFDRWENFGRIRGTSDHLPLFIGV